MCCSRFRVCYGRIYIYTLHIGLAVKEKVITKRRRHLIEIESDAISTFVGSLVRVHKCGEHISVR